MGGPFKIFGKKSKNDSNKNRENDNESQKPLIDKNNSFQDFENEDKFPSAVGGDDYYERGESITRGTIRRSSRLSTSNGTPYPRVRTHTWIEQVIENPENPPPPYVKILFVLMILGAISYVGVDMFVTKEKRTYSKFIDILEWIEVNHYCGPLVFMGIHALFLIFLIPATPLLIAGGYIFTHVHGMALGFVYSILIIYMGNMIGSITAFLLARYMIQNTIREWTDKFQVMIAIDYSLTSHGFKLATLMNLSPAIPTSILNYLMGITSVALIDFLMGSIGWFPWIIFCTYVGSALQGIGEATEAADEDIKAESGNSLYKMMLMALGGVATIASIVYITQYTKEALSEHMFDEDDAFPRKSVQKRQSVKQISRKSLRTSQLQPLIE